MRQMQLAKHTPRQVIQLAYLCALLEKRQHATASKRFAAIDDFLRKAVQIVPVESIFDSIAYGKHETAILCAKILQERKLPLQPSQHMIMGALRASIRARTGYDGRIIDRFIIPTVKTYEQALMAGSWWLNAKAHPIPLPSIGMQVVVEAKPQPTSQSNISPETSHSSFERRPVQPSSKRFRPSMTYSDVTRGSHTQTAQVMTVPLPIPIFLDPHHFPACHQFPVYIIEYLDVCLRNLIGQIQTNIGPCEVLTRNNISELYSVRGGRSAHFKSPLQILSEGISKLESLAESPSFQASKLPNE